MKSESFAIIGLLRERRQQTALVKLQTSNAERDLAEREAQNYANYLRSQAKLQLEREANAYQGALNGNLFPDDLDLVNARIDRERGEIRDLSTQSAALNDVAENKRSLSNDAKVRHALLLRAKKKWEKLQEHHANKTQLQQIYEEELALDNAKLSGNGS